MAPSLVFIGILAVAVISGLLGPIYYTTRVVPDKMPDYAKDVIGFHVWLGRKAAGFAPGWFVLGAAGLGLSTSTGSYWAAMATAVCYIMAFGGVEDQRYAAEKDADQAEKETLRWKREADDLATQLHELSFDRDLFESYLDAVGGDVDTAKALEDGEVVRVGMKTKELRAHELYDVSETKTANMKPETSPPRREDCADEADYYLAVAEHIRSR